MQITFDEKKRLDTNPIFNLFVQGENMAESIRIVGPKMVGALDLSQLRMAVRVTSAAYETMVEKTLEQTVSDEGTITLVWNVDRQFTSNPGHVQVMLVGYGNNEEVIKITSSGIEVKEDETFISAPQGNTWEQILREMQDLATQARTSQTDAAASATKAAASEQVAIYKAEQTAANAKAADTSATLSESWAVGGTGTREGENTNNAQYWAQQAQSIADGQVDLSNYYTKEQSDARYATAAQGALAASAVQSVNGKSGAAVTLAAADVGAAPEFQYSVGSPALTGRKWIDGSDIYAIVIQGTTGAVTTGTYYQFPVSIDMVVSIQGFIQLSGARFWPFPGGVDGPAASHTAIQALVIANGASANANSLYLNIGNSIFASMPFVAILEYTEASV